ncbi:MAG: type II toxin-antitoxin system HicB family antitoxin [Chloroflexota bacterium]
MPGCHSQGRTRAEAVANIEEAIRGYIAGKRKHSEPIPETNVFSESKKSEEIFSAKFGIT